MNESSGAGRWQNRRVQIIHGEGFFLCSSPEGASSGCFPTRLPLVCSVLVLSLLCVLYQPPSSCTRVEIGGKSVRLNKAPLCLCCVPISLSLSPSPGRETHLFWVLVREKDYRMTQSTHSKHSRRI